MEIAIKGFAKFTIICYICDVLGKIFEVGIRYFALSNFNVGQPRSPYRSGFFILWK